MDISTGLGRTVRLLRAEKGRSQEGYADRAGNNRTYVSDVEREKRNPTVTAVEKLATPLDVESGRLLD